MKYFGSFALCLIALSGAFAAPLDGKCADGSPNGAQVPRGHFIFECRDGKIVPMACITDDLKHIDIGSTADKKAYRLKCDKVDDETMSFQPIACLHNGAEHKIDETFEDGANFYLCQRDGKGLKLVNLGCVDNGKRVKLNDQIVKDEYVMLCNETVNSGARLMPSGCVKDGKQYNVGDSFEVGQFAFTCTRVGRERVSLKAAGCVNSGKRLNDGDRYTENEIIKECRIDNGKTSVQTVACAQRDETGNVVERRLGCTWVEGQAPFQYEMQCQADPANNSAKKVTVRCNYSVGGGVYNIEPGCYRVIDKAAFGCLKEASSLKLQSFQGDNAEQAATGAGLHSC
jgi:hypothetical protein